MRADGGYVRVYRRVWDNVVFRNGREAAAFVWMISMAQWDDTSIGTKFGNVALQAGEVIVAERDLASRFGLDRNAVHRLLGRMADAGMIRADRDRATTRIGRVVSIINYKEYQWFNQGSAAENVSQSRTHVEPHVNLARASECHGDCQESHGLNGLICDVVNRSRTEPEHGLNPSRDKNKEGIQKKEGKKKESLSSAEAADASAAQPEAVPIDDKPKRKGVTRKLPPPAATQDLVTAFERWWSEYPRVRRVDKADTLKAYLKARAIADENTLLNGLRNFVFDHSENGRWIVHPQRWLSRTKWLDDPASQIVRTDPKPDPDAWRREMRAKRAQAAQQEMPFEGQTIEGKILEAEPT